MTDMLKRDITGECEGECRDLAREGEEKRQDEINASGLNLRNLIRMPIGRDPEMNRPVSLADTYRAGVMSSCHLKKKIYT